MSEVNEVPEGWAIERLGDVCFTTSGGTPSRKNPDYYIGNIPWVKSGELDKGLIVDTEEKISDAAVKNSSAKVFPQGTLLIALYGATIGKQAFLGVDAATNQAICGIFKNEVIDLNFLNYFLFHRRHKLIEQGAGGAQPNISQTILKNLEVPLPPLAEQHRIVAKIEELFINLDKGIESLKTVQQQLKVYRQAVLKWAFEGKLSESGLGGLKDLRMKGDTKDKKILQSPNPENPDSDKGELPEGWKWVKLGDLVDDIEAGKSFKCDERPPIKDQVGILKVSAISWGAFDEMESKTVTDNDKINFDYLVEPGDFILSRANTLELVGAVVIVKSISKRLLLSDKTLRITFSPFLSDQYALYYLRSKNGRKQIQGYSSGNQESMRNIGQAGIKNIEIPLPKNIEEQNKIVAEIESRLSVCDKIEESISQSLQQAEALRQSILKKAFEGTLVPQDPNDEPASVLLERIRAEREAQVKAKPVKTKKVKMAQVERVPKAGEQLTLL